VARGGIHKKAAHCRVTVNPAAAVWRSQIIKGEKFPGNNRGGGREGVGGGEGRTLSCAEREREMIKRLVRQGRWSSASGKGCRGGALRRLNEANDGTRQMGGSRKGGLPFSKKSTKSWEQQENRRGLGKE